MSPSSRTKKNLEYCFDPSCLQLEIDPYGCLHDARRTSCAGCAKTGARLIAGSVKCHGPINVCEICAVENVVGFPAQLNCPFLSPAEFLKNATSLLKMLGSRIRFLCRSPM